MRTAWLSLAFTAALAQNFDAVSVKASARSVGPDYNNQISIGAADFHGRNVTLKRLIGEAFGLQPFQVMGGPKWLGEAEYDVEARSAQPASADQLRAMLRPVLTARFHLVSHNETRDLRIYEMVVDKGGPKVKPGDAAGAPARGSFHFHGDLAQLADMIGIQLTIPSSIHDDPSTPSRASGPPVPVVDKTGLTGVYDLNLGLSPDADPFAGWQRVLQEQLGLRLEARRGPVQVLVVDSADRVPTAN